MRYRIRITRVQVAERSVLAKDEEHAMEKTRAEPGKPYDCSGDGRLPPRRRRSSP